MTWIRTKSWPFLGCLYEASGSLIYILDYSRIILSSRNVTSTLVGEYHHEVWTMENITWRGQSESTIMLRLILHLSSSCPPVEGDNTEIPSVSDTVNRCEQLWSSSLITFSSDTGISSATLSSWPGKYEPVTFLAPLHLLLWLLIKTLVAKPSNF